jgi:hypothetical protein
LPEETLIFSSRTDHAADKTQLATAPSLSLTAGSLHERYDNKANSC